MQPNDLIPRASDDANTRFLKQQYQYHLTQREAAQRALTAQQAELSRPEQWHGSHVPMQADVIRLEAVITENTARMDGIVTELERMAAPPVPAPEYVSEKSVKRTQSKGKANA